jgi:two-component system NtrC family response regulator
MVKDVEAFAPYGRNPAVLVVDANSRLCLLYRMEMEAQGYKVVCANNGHEALQQIEYRNFDIAVVDVILPDVNGIELVQEISAHHQNLPIIVNTSYPYRKSYIQKWGVDAFVLKSSDLNELLNKITYLLQHPRHLHAETAD